MLKMYGVTRKQATQFSIQHDLRALERGNGDKSSPGPIPTIYIRTFVVNPERVAVRISDNGLGIPEALQERVFDPFFTMKPVGQGTGMGMAISYQIVTKQHRGQLQCSSVLGRGAEFTIELPIRAIKQNQLARLNR